MTTNTKKIILPNAADMKPPEWGVNLAKACRGSLSMRHAPCPTGLGCHVATVIRTTPAGLCDARDSFHSEGALFEGDNRASWSGRWEKLGPMLKTGAGDRDVARKIEATVANLQAGSTMGKTYVYAVEGDYPIVPVALSGDPMAMRAKANRERQDGDLRVFLPLHCSASVTIESFTDIVADVAAAVRAIASRRTVTLTAFGSMNAVEAVGGKAANALFITFDCDILYGDSRRLALFTDAGIGRTCMMVLARAVRSGYFGQWAWSKAPRDGTVEMYRRALGMGPKDVFVPPLYGGNGEREAIRGGLVKAAADCGINLNFPKLTNG